jgi:hypothetical protein
MPDYTYQTKNQINSTEDLGLTVVSSTIAGNVITTVLNRATGLNAGEQALLDEYFAKKGMEPVP